MIYQALKRFITEKALSPRLGCGPLRTLDQIDYIEMKIDFCDSERALLVLVLKVGLVLGFFGYLGLSNTTRPLALAFDSSRHTERCICISGRPNYITQVYQKLQSVSGATPVPLQPLRVARFGQGQ